MCSCKCFSKLILIVVNIIFLLAGGLMLAIGIIAKVKPEWIGLLLKNVPGMEHLPGAIDIGSIIGGNIIFMIILGAVVAAVGFFGTCGALCENKFMLGMYMAIVIAILCGEIAIIIYSAVSPDKLKTEIQKVMQKSMANVHEDISYESGGGLKLPNNSFAIGWAFLQVEAHCCGTYNYTDYSGWWHEVALPDGTVVNTTIPVSCCRTNGTVDLANAKVTFDNITACLVGRDINYINSENCYDAVNNIIKKSLTIVIGIAAGIVGAEFILIVAAFCLCRESGKTGDSKSK